MSGPGELVITPCPDIEAAGGNGATTMGWVLTTGWLPDAPLTLPIEFVVPPGTVVDAPPSPPQATEL